jgi:putative spermidine/putrescine transport system substrate-binding protein
MRTKSNNVFVLALIIAAAVLCGAKGVLAAGKGEVIVATTGMTVNWIKSWADDFEKQTGIKLTAVSQWVTGAKLSAMAKTKNVEFDVVQLNIPGIDVGIKENVLVPIEYDTFNREDLKNIEYKPELKHPYGVAFMAFGRGMAYSAEKYPEGTPHPVTWAEFWDVKKFPARRSISLAWSFAPFEGAVMADGAPMDKLYPLDLERAFRSLDKIRPHIHKFAMTNTETDQLFISKEVELADGWYTTLITSIRKGAPIKVEYGQAEFAFNSLSILKGPNGKSNAMEFIKYAMQPKIQARIVEYGYAPINKAAYEFVDPQIAKMLPSYPDNFRKMFLRNETWWAEMTPAGKTNRDLATDMLNSWMLKK